MTIRIVQGHRISTECVCPPIPCRDFDWSAVLDGVYDGAPDSSGVAALIGTGGNEARAIDDLLEQLEELQREVA